MVERAPYKGVVGEFESPLDYHSLISPAVWAGSSAVEQRPFKPLVVSSILTRPTSRGSKKYGSVAQLEEHLASNQDVASSSLARPSKPKRQRREIGKVVNDCKRKGRSSSGPGFRSPKPETRVRISLGLPVDPWQRTYAPVAQLVEHLPCKEDVVGSIPGQGPQSPLTTKGGIKETWGLSSVGRAPALQAGRRRFDPDSFHQVCGGAFVGRPLERARGARLRPRTPHHDVDW